MAPFIEVLSVNSGVRFCVKVKGMWMVKRRWLKEAKIVGKFVSEMLKELHLAAFTGEFGAFSGFVVECQMSVI